MLLEQALGLDGSNFASRHGKCVCMGFSVQWSEYYNGVTRARAQFPAVLSLLDNLTFRLYQLISSLPFVKEMLGKKLVTHPKVVKE